MKIRRNHKKNYHYYKDNDYHTNYLKKLISATSDKIVVAILSLILYAILHYFNLI